MAKKKQAAETPVTTTAIQIDTDYEMPTGRDKYPWDDLQKGQSFWHSKRPLAPKKYPKGTFASRKDGEGFRTWRVA